jgi:hypothetical protein
LNNLDLLNAYPCLEYLPADFSFLSLPLFFLYVKEISVLKIKPADYRLLIPGIIEFVVNVMWFVFYNNSETFMQYRLIYKIIHLALFIPFNFYILTLIIKLEKKHKIIVSEQYSSTENMSIKWCRDVAVV